jgi:hypothetical protein
LIKSHDDRPEDSKMPLRKRASVQKCISAIANNWTGINANTQNDVAKHVDTAQVQSSWASAPGDGQAESSIQRASNPVTSGIRRVR